MVESGTGATAAFLSRALATLLCQHSAHSSTAALANSSDSDDSRTSSRHISDGNLTGGVLDIEVVAVSVVMAPDDLMTAMKTLLQQTGSGNVPECLSVLPYPQALLAKGNGKRRVFGRPISDHYQLWLSLQETAGFEFDLLYAPMAWEQLLYSPEWGACLQPDKLEGECGNMTGASSSLGGWGSDVNVLYLHCGGVEGNCTQLPRYTQAQRGSR